jgi:uncharacterized membrane protein YphA (DoxX/SURF4 family)
MKIASNIAGGLLGFLFFAFSLMFFFNLMKDPNPPAEGTPADFFMKAFYPTGYLHFVKVFELIGGILVAIPKTRNYGLLVLGPIIINILAFHYFVKGDGIFDPILIVIMALALFLLWSGRKAFRGLLN